MNFDHASMPFEVWCDTLEDEGLTTEDLRLLFNQNNGGDGCEEICGVWHGNGEGFGFEDRYVFGFFYGYGDEFGDGFGKEIGESYGGDLGNGYESAPEP